MNMTMFKTALFFAAALFMVNCGDSSESTPAAPAETSATVPVEITPAIPEDSAEVPSITVTDSVDTTEYSCHDSKWIPKENFDMMIVNNPQSYAMQKAPYMAYKKSFYFFLEDTVAQLHYESTGYGWYPDSTPFCLIEMIDSIGSYHHIYQWFSDEENVSHDSIATEIECSNGTVYPKHEYAVYTEILNAYNEQKKLYNQLYDSLYEKSLHDIKALLDSCLNHPEDFPITDPNYKERYQSYWLTHDEFEDDDETEAD